MKWNKEKIILVILITLLTIAAIVSVIYNFENFFTFSVGEFMTLAITVIVGYYLVESKSDDRILNERIISTVEKIEDKLSTTEYIKINPKKNWGEILANNRWLKNKIYVLERFSKKNNKISKYVKKIKEEFDAYESFVTTNITFTKEKYEDPAIYTEQKRKIDNINFQLELIILCVYDVPEE